MFLAVIIQITNGCINKLLLKSYIINAIIAFVKYIYKYILSRMQISPKLQNPTKIQGGEKEWQTLNQLRKE